MQAVALRRGLFARLSAGSSGGSLGGSPDGTSGRSSGGSSGGSTVTADLSPKSAIVLKALAKAVAQSEKRSEQRAAAQAQRFEQRAAERTEELKRCLAKEFAESKLHTTQTVKNDGDETRTAVVSTAKANMMAMFSVNQAQQQAQQAQQEQQQASCLSLLDHITTTASDAAADRTRHASEAATERTCVEERQKVQMGALGGEMQQAVKETRNMLVQSHNQVTTDVIAALNPITEEMRMAIAVLLGSTQDLQAPSQLGAVAGLLGQIQADTSLLRSAFVNECGEPGGAIFDVIKQMVDKLPTAAKEADEAKATLAQEEAKATALAEAKATADAKAAEEAEATAKAAAAKARSRRPAAVKASAAFSKPPSSTKSSSAKAAPPVPPPPPLAPVSGVQTVTGAAARLKDPSSDHSVMIASLGRLQPLLRRVPVEKRAALLSPTGIISVGLACAIAFRRTAVVQKSLEVLEALAGEFTTDLAGVVSAVMEVIILHCSRAKESSVWIPCKKAAPIIAVKAPSNELLLALMDCVVNKASEVNKYAGCREAAGLALSALLNSAVRGEIAKGIVMPNVDAIADAIVALLIDATKPKQGGELRDRLSIPGPLHHCAAPPPHTLHPVRC